MAWYSGIMVFYWGFDMGDFILKFVEPLVELN